MAPAAAAAAIQARSVAPAVAVASIQERFVASAAAVAAIQERSVAPGLEAEVAASGSVARPVAEARTLRRPDQWRLQRSVTWNGALRTSEARRSRDPNIIVD